ncbi:MAG: hypothetical protein H0W88_00395 [Parachlamydiaceae bacterium]|nr:hypothetical protein [Parachlamydiaceae bacterium]
MLQPSSPISIKIKAKPSLQASKWLTIPVLLDVQEMEKLISHLGNFGIFLVSGPVAASQAEIGHQDFINCYKKYIDALKKGEMPVQDVFWRTCFSSVWTVTSDVLYAISIEGDRQLIKAERPVIQLQPHKFDYSEVDGKFRSMVLGPQSIVWGIQFSYPQLFQNDLFEVKTVNESPEFPNTTLFKLLQRWIRNNTVATPFIVHEKRTNSPIRLGKLCFDWINIHPQLLERGIRVFTS